MSRKIIADGDATGTVRASRSVILCTTAFFSCHLRKRPWKWRVPSGSFLFWVAKSLLTVMLQGLSVHHAAWFFAPFFSFQPAWYFWIGTVRAVEGRRKWVASWKMRRCASLSNDVINSIMAFHWQHGTTFVEPFINQWYNLCFSRERLRRVLRKKQPLYYIFTSSHLLI